MRMTKSMAYEHLAKRNREGEQDIPDKFKVINILREDFSLYGLTGETLMIDSEHCRLPDILIKGKPTVVIELDGEFHGNGEDISKKDSDIDRDNDYRRLGVKLIIINKLSTNGYEYDQVKQALLQNGLELLQSKKKVFDTPRPHYTREVDSQD